MLAQDSIPPRYPLLPRRSVFSHETRFSHRGPYQGRPRWFAPSSFRSNHPTGHGGGQRSQRQLSLRGDRSSKTRSCYSAGPLEDGSHVVVWLVPTKPGQVARLHTEPPHYRIIQHHKMFEPRLLVVPAGSVVEFPNHDPWLHNVFSVSRSRRFDLGLYEGGVQKAVTLTAPVFLICSAKSIRK